MLIWILVGVVVKKPVDRLSVEIAIRKAARSMLTITEALWQAALCHIAWNHRASPAEIVI
jgi:hypothetical protein